MQHIKNTAKISEVGKYTSDSDTLFKTFESIIGQFKLAKVNALLNQSKSKGIEGEHIFKVLFALTFIDLKNVSQFMLSGYGTHLRYGKDVLYEFLKNEWVDWQKILTIFAKRFLHIVRIKGDATDLCGPKCLIIDDTILDKTGKTIEKIGHVFDHCSHSFHLGMKVLVCGFWDGKSIVPVTFSVHNEPGKEGSGGLRKKDLARQFHKERHPDSPGFQRISQLTTDKINMAVQMIKSAVSKGFDADYVLADSWYICDTFLCQIQNISSRFKKKLHVIGLMKINRRVNINGKLLIASLIPERMRKQIRVCKEFKCRYVSLPITYKGTPAKAFWVKMDGSDTWKLLISTDLGLRFLKAMRYYQIRWSIEVFFKECKQNLNLNRCQSTDFDAHVAHITLSFLGYLIVSLRKRFDDYETLGAIFREMKNELLEKNVVEKIWQIMTEVYEKIIAGFGIDWECFLNKLVEQEIHVEKFAQIQLAFLKHPNK